MHLALKDAKIEKKAIGYINAHGTSTPQGDIAEAQATFEVFGNTTPISSFKGNFCHTLGACGAIEAALSIKMMINKSLLIYGCTNAKKKYFTHLFLKFVKTNLIFKCF